MANLLSNKQTASRFGLDAKTFRRNRALIVANHKLTPIRVGRSYHYNEGQVERLVKKLTRTGDPLYFIPDAQELKRLRKES